MLINKKGIKGQGRQGDVMMEKWDGTVPEGAKMKNVSMNKLVLAYGEVTLHSHSIKFDPATMTAWEDDNFLYLTAKEPFVIEHGEHDHIPALEAGLEADSNGIYHAKFGIQVEYSPQKISRVLD